MRMAEKLGHLSNRFYDRMRHRAAFTITDADAIEGGFESLRGHKYATLVTFRRNGEAMPSPVWFGLDDRGHAYIHTMHDAGKVKRIRNDGRALIVAANTRGKPLGKPMRGTARIVPEHEWPHAEAALAAAYGTGRKLYTRVFGGERNFQALGAYIEVSPVVSV
jgi:uncharacterized protein